MKIRIEKKINELLRKEEIEVDGCISSNVLEWEEIEDLFFDFLEENSLSFGGAIYTKEERSNEG